MFELVNKYSLVSDA